MGYKLSSREKNLLIIGLIVIIGVVFYSFVYSNLSQRLENLKTQYETLTAELSRLNMIISNYNAHKAEIENAKKEYAKLKDIIPPNQNALFCVVDLKRLLETVKISTSSYMFEPSQKIELGNTKNMGDQFYPYYLSSRQTWNCEYEKIHTILDKQPNFAPLFTIDSLNMTKAENKLTVNAVIKFYGFNDPQSPAREFVLNKTIKKSPSGKNNLFK